MKVSVYVNHHLGPGLFAEGEGVTVQEAIADAFVAAMVKEPGNIHDALVSGMGLDLRINQLPR